MLFGDVVKQLSISEMNSPILDAIYNRRSRREYTDQTVDDSKLHEVIKAGIWAPSGLNNQPWRFAIVKDPAIREKIADQTHYSHIVLNAPALIAVYLDKESMYDEVKDHQAAGACIQNMLLAAEALGLGAVWLGQILKNKDEVLRILDLGNNLDLMAVVALGYPKRTDQKSSRKKIEDFIVKEL